MNNTPNPVALSSDRRRLRLTQVLLILLILTLSLVGRRSDLWPIVTWPVYGDVRPPVPGPTYSALQIRAQTESGGELKLGREALVEWSRHKITDLVLAGAVTDFDDRVYLAKLIRRTVDEELDTVEIWEVQWQVDNTTVPPIDLAHPSSQTMLVGFSVRSGDVP